MKTLNDKDFNQIENFISGNLSPDEDKKFRERLAKETNLAKAYDFRTKIAKYWNEAESYKTTKRQINELFKREQNAKKKFITFIYAAASVVILIGISIFYLQQTKHGTSDYKLTNIGKDTSSITISPLSTNIQPEKSTLYINTPEYSSNDTLIIQRAKDFKNIEKILIKRVDGNNILKEYVLAAKVDSLLIPMKGLQPGSYQWIIIGTEYSGNFIIKDHPEIKK